MRKIVCRTFRILPVVSYSSVRPHICSLSSFTAQAPVGCFFNYRSRRLIGSGLRDLRIMYMYAPCYVLCVHLCLFLCPPPPMNANIHTYIHTHTHTHIYIYIYIYIYTHTHLSTHITLTNTP